MVKMYFGFQMDAVPGIMKWPFGKQEELLSLEARPGARMARRMIGMTATIRMKNAIGSLVSANGSHNLWGERAVC
jgi:hypothetical protein